jgi:hypothetical protein
MDCMIGLGCDFYHLDATVGPARHTNVMRQLFGLALRALDKGLKLERVVCPASVSSRFGNSTFRLCGHSVYS